MRNVVPNTLLMTNLTRLFTLFVCLLLGLIAHAEGCRPPLLSKGALKLVKRLIEYRIKEDTTEFNEDGGYGDQDLYAREVEKRFTAIMENRSKAGDEALAYLLNIYMGEGPDEDMVCEAINRGKRMLPLIREYRKCIPLIGLEPLPGPVRGSGSLPALAEEGILKGEKCNLD
jgi:hypothetical protein